MDRVSSWQCVVGAMVAMMHVLVLPPSESRSSLVSLLSLHALQADGHQSLKKSQALEVRMWPM